MALDLVMVERVYGFTVSVCVCDKMVQDYQTRDGQTVGRLAKNARPCESTASFRTVLIITLPQSYDRKKQY